MYVLLYSLDNIAYGESVRYGFCRRFAVRLFTLAVCRKVQFYQRADLFRSSRFASPEVSCSNIGVLRSSASVFPA